MVSRCEEAQGLCRPEEGRAALAREGQEKEEERAEEGSRPLWSARTEQPRFGQINRLPPAQAPTPYYCSKAKNEVTRGSVPFSSCTPSIRIEELSAVLKTGMHGLPVS